MKRSGFHYLVLAALTLSVSTILVGCGSSDPTPIATAPPKLPAPTPTPTTADAAALSEGEPTASPAVPTYAEDPATVVILEAMEPRQVGGSIGDLAPEFTGIASWINSEPLTMEALRGKVVLIDFWTYTCVNCIRTFPYLREWHEKYADVGLVIVGVHSPEFEFEKVRENVVSSVDEHLLTYTIAQDNNFRIWNAYENRFWPAKYLVDSEGTVQYTHFGEGAYAETELIIRSLLEDAGADVSDIAAGTDSGPVPIDIARTENPQARLTRELYGGYERNAFGGYYINHDQYYRGPNLSLDYSDPGSYRNHFLYLQGSWYNGLESLVHSRETQDYEDYIGLQFAATSVNVVINPEVDEPFEVLVTMDGRPLAPEEAGTDIVIKDGRSFFVVDEGRMYRIVELPDFGVHDLKLSSNSTGFAFFAFTFGAYTEGP